MKTTMLGRGFEMIARAAMFVLCAVAADKVNAQAFNIDFGPNGPPSSSYGAAANQFGEWNQNPFDTTLVDVNGNATGVQLTPNEEFDIDPYEGAEVDEMTPDEVMLFGDGNIMFMDFAGVEFANLAHGRYRVFVYAPWTGDVASFPESATTIAVPDAVIEQRQVTLDPSGDFDDLAPWAGPVSGYSYASFVVDVTDETMSILFSGAEGIPGINGIQLVPLDETIVTAVPGSSGDWNDGPNWTDGDVPDTPAEIAGVDGEETVSTDLALDEIIETAEALVNAGDSVTCDTGGELAAPMVTIDGEWILNDTFSSGIANAGIFADAFGGSGSISANTQWQNFIGSFTPEGTFTVAPTLQVVAPDGTELFVADNVFNAGEFIADGGAVNHNAITIENINRLIAQDGGTQNISDCDIENTFGEFLAADGTCEFNDSTIVGGRCTATGTGTCQYADTICEGVTLMGDGTHAFAGENSWQGIDPIPMRCNQTMVLLETGEIALVGLEGDVILESATMFAPLDPSGFGKQWRVETAATIVGDEDSALVMSDSSNQSIGGPGQLTLDVRVEGACNLGFDGLTITCLNQIIANLTGETILINPGPGGFTGGEGCSLQSTNEASLELRDGEFVFTPGANLSANGGGILFRDADCANANMSADNGGQYVAINDTDFRGTTTLNPGVTVVVPPLEQLFLFEVVNSAGFIEMQGDPNGPGASCWVADGLLLNCMDESIATRTGTGGIVGTISDNAAMRALDGNATITNCFTHVIGGALDVGFGGGLTIINNGKMRGDLPGETMRIRALVQNDHVIEAVGGGNTTILDTQVDQGPAGIIRVIDDSTASIDNSTVNNDEESGLRGEDNAVLSFLDAVVNGGFVVTVDDATVSIVNSAFNGVDLDANVVVVDNFTIDGDLVNPQSLTLEDEAQLNLPPATWSLSGAGGFFMGADSGVNGASTTVTNVDYTISGAGSWNVPSFVNQAQVNADGMTMNDVTNDTGGDFTIDVGGLLVNGLYQQADGASLTIGGTVTADDGYDFAGGSVNGGDGGSMNGSAYNGAAFVILGGGLSAGTSTGIFTINGDYTQSMDGSLAIKVAGDEPGAGHDQLVVNGSVDLAGTLEPSVADGYDPQGGESFTIIDVSDGVVTGAFDAIVGPGEWSVSYNETTVVLTLVTPPVEGDLDGSGSVDVADLLILLAAWGDCPDPPEACPADLDGSSVVDVSDLLVLLANWS